MWRPAASLCFFLAVTIDSFTAGLPPPINSGSRSVIKLLGVDHFLYFTEKNVPHIYEINRGEKLSCLTDPTRSKLIAIFELGNWRPFVIPYSNGYKKVEVLIIDNVAEHTIEESQEYNPLQYFKNSRDDLRQYTRLLEIPISQRRSSIATGLMPRPVTPQLPLIKLIGVNHFLASTGSNGPHIYEIPPGAQIKCITDPTGSKLVAVVELGQQCSFVIVNGNGYQKVEVLIIGNEAKHTMIVSRDHDPLRDFRTSGKDWTQHIRYAQVLKGSRYIPPAVVPIQQRRSRPTLPRIQLLGVHNFLIFDKQNRPHIYKINPGVKLRCITDPTGSRLVAILDLGQKCSFVILNEKGYEKVEVPITGNVAMNPIVVSKNHNPLEEFKNKDWGQYIRFVEIPDFRGMGAPGSSGSPRSLGSPGSVASPGLTGLNGLNKRTGTALRIA